MDVWYRTAACLAAVLFCSACSAAEEPSAETEAQESPAHTADNGEPAEPESTASDHPEDSDNAKDPGRHSDASFDPESIYVLVNKHNRLEPEDFVPPDLEDVDVPQQFGGQQLREQAASAMEELVAEAADDGVDLWVTTAYRDYGHQQALYDQHLAAGGQEAADELTARPGHSEHHTGLAVDISFEGNQHCNLRACFAETEQGQWLEENVDQFGFIIRYPEGAEEITGYSFEPWHLRYVGEPTATEVTAQEVTLEEYWDQPPAPDYEDDYR